MPSGNPSHSELLAACPLFRGLSPRSIQDLAALCVERSVPKGGTLFMEGQRGQAVYLLVSGSVQLVKTTENGREIVIRTVSPGDMFAEIVLFELETYPVTANVLSSSRVLEISPAAFRGLLNQESFRTDFMAGLMRRMRYLTERIVELMSYDVDERFLRFLESQYGRKPSYTLPLSKKSLAAAIGATPETLSRMILRLEQARQIRWEGRRLEISPALWKSRGPGEPPPEPRAAINRKRESR